MAKITKVFQNNIAIEGVVANNSLGFNNQVLSSNGSSTYWANKDSGPIGFTGSRGFTGSQGAIGFTGSQGVTGFIGSQGYTGSQGVPGVTAFDDGTEASPSIYFTSDPDTGLYRSNTNEISITAGATRRARFGADSSIYGGLNVNGSLATSGAITENGQQVWHAGNFNPALYAPLSGARFTNDVGIGTATVTPIFGRTLQIGDGSLNATISLKGPSGDAYFATSGTNALLIARTGMALQLGAGNSIRATIDTSGATSFTNSSFTVGGNQVWHAGNFNPANYAALSGASFTGYTSILTAADGDKFEVGKTTGQKLYFYSDVATLGLFNTPGAGVGRDGFRITNGAVLFDIDAAPIAYIDIDGFYPGAAGTKNLGWPGGGEWNNLFMAGQLNINNLSDSARGGRLYVSGAAGSGNFHIASTSSGYGLAFEIDAVEKMRLDTNGRLRIGSSLGTSQNALIYVGAADGTPYALGLSGTTKAIRFQFSSTTASIIGVDPTLVTSFQPLSIGGSTMIYSAQSGGNHQFTVAGAEVGKLSASGLELTMSNGGKMYAEQVGSTSVQLRSSATMRYVVAAASAHQFYIDSASFVQFGPTSITPGTDNSIPLGSTFGRWSNIFSVDGTFYGEVGIGTASPDTLLHISGAGAGATQLRLDSSSTQPAITFYNRDANAANRNWGIIGAYTSFGDLTFRCSTAKDGNPVSAGTTMLRLLSDGQVIFSPGGTEIGRFNGNGLGLGITNPSHKLTVVSNIELARFQTTTARGGGTGYIGIGDPTGRKGYWGYGGANDTMYLINELNEVLAFGTGGTVRWAISAIGNFYPSSDNTYNIGASGNKAASIYGVVLRVGASSLVWTSGSGTPEGAVTAPVGSLYTRSDGGAGTTLYVKESGAGTTGWVAK